MPIIVYRTLAELENKLLKITPFCAQLKFIVIALSIQFEDIGATENKGNLLQHLHSAGCRSEVPSDKYNTENKRRQIKNILRIYLININSFVTYILRAALLEVLNYFGDLRVEFLVGSFVEKKFVYFLCPCEHFKTKLLKCLDTRICKRNC